MNATLAMTTMVHLREVGSPGMAHMMAAMHRLMSSNSPGMLRMMTDAGRGMAHMMSGHP